MLLLAACAAQVVSGELRRTTPLVHTPSATTASRLARTNAAHVFVTHLIFVQTYTHSGLDLCESLKLAVLFVVLTVHSNWL